MWLACPLPDTCCAPPAHSVPPLQLTGGTGYNGRHGVFAADQVAAATLSGSAAASLELPDAVIACAQSTWSCGEFDKTCIAAQDGCPSAGAAAAFLQGGCPTGGKGFELGARRARLAGCCCSRPGPLHLCRAMPLALPQPMH